MREGERVLIVAVSARSLAASARRGGYVPLVADLFCDDDTRALAETCEKVVPGGLCEWPGADLSPDCERKWPSRQRGSDEGGRGARSPSGLPAPPHPSSAPHTQGALSCAVREGSAPHWRTLDADAVVGALTRLAEKHPIAGLVYGTGLEAEPDLVDTIARRWPLLGNRGATVARLKEPTSFAEICRTACVPHPEIAIDPPRNEERSSWLAKRRGGSGGSHVVPAERAEISDDIYFQRRVSGRSVSALFLADGSRACIVGFSEQWTSPTANAPFRYAGAVQPANLTISQTDTVRSAVERITAVAALVGLCSADFLAAEDRVWCLEVNPRPGATLDIFEPEGDSLFALHVRACGGDLPSRPFQRLRARAAQIVYAERDISSVPSIDWPKWAADRQPVGSVVSEGGPLCTVMADAATKEEALLCARSRAAAIMAAASGRAA